MLRPSLVLVALSLSCALAWGQPRPGAEQLPVKQVVLFSSGVGYFQREGVVEGHSRVDLQFHTANINDLLKSLVLQDSQGGHVGTIHYDNRNPVEMTLKSFAIDLTQDPSLADLLRQVRGEQVEIVTVADAKAATVGQAETITGQIVGVEKQQQAVGKEVMQTAQLNLLTKDGLRGVPLGQVQRVRFLKAALEAEFRKALAVLAAGHDKQKKTVSLHFTGSGQRRVRVGYVTESPVWKTSYRLSLDKDRLFLQGWAIVENTTDEDWNNVDLRLVAGRPISFQMDLYQPLFAPRPLIEPELFASLRPQVYGGDMQGGRAEPGAKKTDAAPGAGFQPNTGIAGAAPGMPPVDPTEGAGPPLPELLRKTAAGIRIDENVDGAAATRESGEHFQYLIAQPVSLPRQKSALISIVNEPVRGCQKVSIYNAGVHAKFPMLGIRFQNGKVLHLNQGPVTVFEDGSYAGDALLDDLRPGETRLISYAIDLGTEVEAKPAEADELVKVKVVRGVIHSLFTRRETRTYTVKNRTAQPRLVLIEQPYRPEYRLVAPAKARERSRDVYRFEVRAEPNRPVALAVVEEKPHDELTLLAATHVEPIRELARSRASSEAVRKAIQAALDFQAALAQTQQDVRKEEQALKAIEQDQARMRANMERVPQTSEAYKRYLKKFDDQETEIEQRRLRVGALRAKAEEEQKAYENYLASLTVE